MISTALPRLLARDGPGAAVVPWAEIEFLPRFRWVFVRYQPLGLEEHVRCTLFARQADVLLRAANREPIEKIADLGFGLDSRLPVYTTPRLPAPMIIRR